MKTSVSRTGLLTRLDLNQWFNQLQTVDPEENSGANQ
jgi:hypothetical protein